MKEINLTETISFYILSKLGVLSDNFSIMKFPLEQKIIISENDKDYEKNLYGVSCIIDSLQIRLFLVDLSKDNEKSYLLLSGLKDSPIYAVYIDDNSSHISMYIDDKWTKCSPYFEASLLAGMEYVKENMISYSKLEDSEDLISLSNEFITYFDEL